MLIFPLIIPRLILMTLLLIYKKNKAGTAECFLGTGLMDYCTKTQLYKCIDLGETGLCLMGKYSLLAS